MLNIKEMIAGGPARLRWVYRYQTCRVRHPESVAEHSWYVAFYCIMIANWLIEDQKFEVDTSVMLCRAILHDLEECETGDFPRNFKHASPERHAILEQAGRDAMKAILERMTPNSFGLYVEWKNAKRNDTEGLILELADFLAVLGFLLQEGQGEGNGTIGVHVAEMSKYYGKFQGKEYAFLQPLVQQAGQIMQQLGILDTGVAGGSQGRERSHQGFAE